MEEKVSQLRRYRSNPFSPEMIVRFSQDKEMLEKQYKEVTETLNFAQQVPLPEETGQFHLYFEEQLEKVGNDLDRLEKNTGIKIPDRLGFGKEKPQNREELSVLLSQLAFAGELISIVAETRVSDLSSFQPLPLAEGRFMKVSGKSLFEELEFELKVRAKISTLTKLLYRLANDSYFFTVKDLEIRPVSGKSKKTSRDRGERTGRGRRRRRTTTMLTEKLPEENFEAKKGEGEESELEAKILVSTCLFSQK